MDPQRWKQIKATLAAALERRGQDRAAYLDGVGASDPDLAGEVEELLAHDAVDSFLEHPAVAPRQPGLTSGSRLGQYVIEAELGAGGMGEVYRATDTRLDRTVAIKVLPAALASDPGRRERFGREAKTIAALNHPHICTLFDVGHEAPSGVSGQAVDFLVMEHLEGETLADRLARASGSRRLATGTSAGPEPTARSLKPGVGLPLDEALTIAAQIAGALDTAHQHGITHRDLKPGNIFLTKAGAKLLDFGLAKLEDVRNAKASAEGSTKPADSLTAEGTILGTFQYMAPEQLEGQETDARTDIWAFGCVLYEMVTGVRAFEGPTQASVAGAIMSVTPPLVSVHQPAAPPVLDHVVATCLARDPDQRWQGAGDIARQLRWVMEGGSGEDVAVRARWPRWPQGRVRGLAASALLAAIATGLALWGWPGPSPRQIVRYSIVVPPTQRLTGVSGRTVAVSPTGTQVVYVADKRLYLRSLDQDDARPIGGTEDTAPLSPFFAPDGQWVGFYSGGQLKKVALAGGTPITLCRTQAVGGASWGSDGNIVFSERGYLGATTDGGFPSSVQGAMATRLAGILRVSGSGGDPEVLIPWDVERGELHSPQMLPGGQAVLFTLVTTSVLGVGGDRRILDDDQIAVQSLATGERRVVIDRGTGGRYLSTGHLVFTRGGTLFAVPFDVDRLAVNGSPVPLLTDVRPAEDIGDANVDVSRDGSLVYMPGEVRLGPRRLVWVDRDGGEAPLEAAPRAYRVLRISPDGAQVALEIRDEDEDIWIWDVRGKALRRLTFGPAVERSPAWTPDGQRVVFWSDRDGGGMFSTAADGSGSVERLTTSPHRQLPYSVTPDGSSVMFYQPSPETSWDVLALALAGDGSPEPLVQTHAADGAGVVSPDGRWLAHFSYESGGFEIYVRPFPDTAQGEWQISNGTAVYPVWAPDSQAIFYATPDGIMRVSVDTDPVFTPGDPELFVQGSFYRGASDSRFDVSADGQRFLVIREIEQPDESVQIRVVLNWTDELVARVPIP